LAYPEPGTVRAQYGEAATSVEAIAGTLQVAAERRYTVAWDWPGEDGMFHRVRAIWQPGELIVRPLEWLHQRRPFPTPDPRVAPVPWPLNVAITVRGWHDQLLEYAEIVASDAKRSYPVHWPPPHGRLRPPRTDLPCTLATPGREHPESMAALTLAGLTLPWRIDLDRQSWVIWRRFAGAALLDRLGAPAGTCPRHGHSCPWPASGRM
jgi:hypothetical protein